MLTFNLIDLQPSRPLTPSCICFHSVLNFKLSLQPLLSRPPLLHWIRCSPLRHRQLLLLRSLTPRRLHRHWVGPRLHNFLVSLDRLLPSDGSSTVYVPVGPATNSPLDPQIVLLYGRHPQSPSRVLSEARGPSPSHQAGASRRCLHRRLGPPSLQHRHHAWIGLSSKSRGSHS